MSHNTGFPPIARKDARILILGSMPSEKSLQEQQYYAHPRNAFWPIICELFDSPEVQNYQRRKQLLLDNHIALWDVLKSCYRKGSLDSDIDHSTIECNDFQDFFAKHRQIKKVFLNGGMAEQLFKKYVLKELAAFSINYQRLPSTSPAHAAMNRQAKLNAWRVVTVAS